MPLSGVVCSAAGACLPLTTTAPISDRATCEDGKWILFSATVPLASGVCDDGGAWLSVSAAVLLATGDCCDGRAGAAPSAVVPTGGTCEPAVTGAWIGAVDEFAVGAFHLWSSKLTSDGSIYRIEQSYDLETYFEELGHDETDD